MRCPVCKDSMLSHRELDDNLQSYSCAKCGGSWIPSFCYWHWREQHGEDLPEKSPPAGADLSSAERPGAKFCPECKHVLIMHRIGRDIDFHLDRCAFCGGIWFDQNEWKLLKSRNLHDDVHYIFSQSWQSSVRKEERTKHLDEIWQQQFGGSDFEEIRRIKEWIDSKSYSAELYSYLLQNKGKPMPVSARRPSDKS